MKKLISAILLLATIVSSNITVCAKEKAQSYNLSRALELFADEEYEKGVEYLKKEVAENPKCVKAYEMLAYYYGSKFENGKALSAVNLALKYTSKKDKTSRAYAHYIRGKVYLQLKDTVQAIPDYLRAIKLNPADSDYAEELANLYFELKRYRDADAIYNDLVEKNPGYAFPLFGLARNAYNEGRYDEARALVAKVRLLSPNDEMCERIEMRINFRENKHKASLDKALLLLSNDFYDAEACHVLYAVSDSIYNSTINALTKKTFEDKTNSDNWELLKAMVQQNHKDYSSSASTIQSIIDRNSDLKAVAMIYLIDCYEELEDLSKMERTATLYLELYPDNPNALLKRADAKFFTGRYDEAAQDYIKTMEIEPKYGYFCYYRLGCIEEMKKNYEAALEYYDKSIALDETYAYIYMMKGCLLKERLNRPEEAVEAFKLCIAKDSIAENGCAMPYAYVGLEQRDKAVEVMDSIIALNPDNAGTYYDAACIYSRLREKDNALKALRIAFEKGYKKFRHVENDDDMDFIRDTPEFNALLEEFDKSDEVSNDTSIVSTVTHEIPLTRQAGGTYLVKASVNGLPMDFILDTGCSSVSISQVESDFMLKNGYLSSDDFKGEQHYVDANGDVNKSQMINLATVKLGDLEVSNIRAGIVPNQKAPLLLGQEVLAKFGKVEIDTLHNLLKITTNK